MSLKTTYSAQEEIPEEYRSLYSRNAETGLWTLSGIEGLRPEAEWRKLEQELSAGRDSADRLAALFEKAGVKPEELPEFAAERGRLRAELESARSELQESTRKLRSGAIERELRIAARKLGVRDEAVDDVLARAAEFTLDAENRVVHPQGETFLSAEQWLEKQLKDSPHWLSPSRSAGARQFIRTYMRGKPAPASVSDLVNESWNNKRS